jgi:hypothetical protein
LERYRNKHSRKASSVAAKTSWNRFKWAS